MPTYHISPTGNDTNNGLTPATAWKTIAKANEKKQALLPGDQILFERGGTYQGNLAIASSGNATLPIIVGVYGTGALPKLVGSKKTTSWTLHSGNVWKTTVTEEVKYVYQNDELLKLARWPSEGFMTNDLATTTQIYDAALTQPDGYFNGASIVVRGTAWGYYHAKVQSYASKTLYFDKSIGTNGMGSYAWGYYLTNKLEFLDREGEWYFDKPTGVLYLWAKGGVDPNTVNIEVSTLKTKDFAVQISYNTQYVYISDLDTSRYTEGGIGISGPFNRVERCNIHDSYLGLNIYGGNNVIRNNEIHDTYATGLFITGGDDNLVEDNNLENIAIIPGIGEHSWGYMGLRISGLRTIIRGNTLNKIGYIGIALSDNQVCENNLIKNACYILNDGSGIAFDNADGLIIRNNIVLDTIGNIDGVPPTWEGAKPKGKGIYFGNTKLNNVSVLNNTVSRCNGAGIWVDHVKTSSGNVIAGNTLFNNDLYQLGLSDWSNAMSPAVNGSHAVPAYNDIVKDNICYAMSPLQDSMFQIHGHYHDVDFGTFSNNVFYNPHKTDHIRVEYIVPTHSFASFTLASWKAATNDDAGSTAVGGTSTTSGDHMLVYNDGDASSSITLPPGTWSDVKNVLHNGSVTLAPFASKILFKTTSAVVPTITSVSAVSDKASVNEGTTALLSATVQGTGAFDSSVAWTVVSGGGTLSSANGAQVTYTAPMVGADTNVTVKATSVADATKSTNVQLTVINGVVAPTITSVSATSDKTNVNEGTTALLTATVQGTGTFDNSVTWTVVSGGGTLSSTSGAQVTYTAPMVGADTAVTIKVTSVGDATKSANVQLSVINGVTTTPTITSVSVAANPTTVNENGTSQLTAVVNGTGAFNGAVTWRFLYPGLGTLSSTSGPTVTYTAPSVTSDKTTRVRVTSVANRNKYATITLTIKNVVTPTITSVSVAASPSTITAGGTSTLTATVQGTGSFNNAVTWVVVSGGGTLSSTSGAQVVYTAPAVVSQQAIIIRATSVGDSSKVGNATVMVNPVVGTVTSVNITSSSSSVNEGNTMTLTADVQGTGPFTNNVTWSIVSGGGTLNSSTANPVTYTAPIVNANTTVVIRAISAYDVSKSAEKTITVNDAPISVPGLNVPPAEMGIVINLDDPTSQAIANEYVSRWGVPASNVVSVRLGNDENATSSEIATVRQQIAAALPSTVQWLALCFLNPSRVNDNSITWAMTMGYSAISGSLHTNPIYGYTGVKPFADKGVRPSMLVISAALVQKAKAAHKTYPTGTCYMLAANDQGGQPRGRSRLSQMQALNGSTSYTGVSFSFTSNLSGPGGENPANNIMNKPDMLFYFNGMYKIYGMETNVVRAGAVGDYVTSTSGNLPSGLGQTPITYMIQNGFIGTMGTVVEPWQDLPGASPGSLVEQFTNIQTFVPLYHGGRSLIDAYWKSIKWPTRSLIIGDPLAAPWGTGGSGGGGPLPVMGCTDPAATNYNPSATVNDGSCTYPPSAAKWATSFDGSGPSLMATAGGVNIAPAQPWSNGTIVGGSMTTTTSTTYPWTLGTITKIVLKGVTFSTSDSFAYTRINSHFIVKPDGKVIFSFNGVSHNTGVTVAKGTKYDTVELLVPSVGVNAITTILGGVLSSGSSCLLTLEGMEVYG